MEGKSFIQGFIGHAAAVRVLSHALEAPAAAYALIGVPHLGKRTLAMAFVRALLGLGPEDVQPLRAHPDLVLLEPEEGKKLISVEQVRDLRERMSMRPMRAPRVVAYVPSADLLNESGTNALLKVVEEPPAGAVFVLVAEDAGRMPATLRSRCVMLPLSPVPRDEIEKVLLARRMTKAEATARASAARGRPGLALEPKEGETRGKGFATAMLAANLGRRLQLIEALTKACDADEVPTEAWRNTLQTAMVECGAALREQSRAAVLGIGLTAAMRSVGSSVSPRILLEATALRMDGDQLTEVRRLLPAHVSRGLPGLFL